jgi:hypothetical protein
MRCAIPRESVEICHVLAPDQNQTTMITFGPTIATPRIAQKFRK